MKCQDVQAGHVIERYLNNQLSESERDEFEKHYFDCDACFQELEAARVAQAVLREQQPPSAASVRPVIMKKRREPWVFIFASAAVVLIVAAVAFIWLIRQSGDATGSRVVAGVPPRQSSPVSPERFQLLAQFEPPPYTPTALRGGGTAKPSHFRTGMERYLKKDYAGAIPELKTALKAQPGFAQAQFYLGICELLTGDRASGNEDLRKVIAAGDTPYLEGARFYLAKSLLGEGRIAEARQLLEDVASMHGDLEKQAQALVPQLK